MPQNALNSVPLSPASHEPSVLVVLLNWNSAEDTIEAVKSVLALDYTNFSIVVIDNGSSDNSAERLRPLASERIHLIFNQENLGYTGGCNQGIRLAMERGDDFVWLLNNDAVTSPGTLRSLVALAETDPSLALVSPQIASLQEPDQFLNLGGIFRPEVPLFQSTKIMAQAREHARSQSSQVILMGTAILARVAALRRIGILDDRLFAYWEDSDLSVRSIAAGYRNAVDFNATIFHRDKNFLVDPHAMRPHFWYYMSRNEVRFWRKHLPIGLRLFKALRWAFLYNRTCMQFIAHIPESRQALVAGVWDGWLGRTGAWSPERHGPAFLARLLAPRKSSAVPARSASEA